MQGVHINLANINTMKTLTIAVPEWNNLLRQVDIDSYSLLPVADTILLGHWLNHALDQTYECVRFHFMEDDMDAKSWILNNTLWPIEKEVVLDDELFAFAHMFMNRLPDMIGNKNPIKMENAWDILRHRAYMEAEVIQQTPVRDRLGERIKKEEDCRISDDAMLGSDITVGHDVSIGAGCFIGNGAILSDGVELSMTRLDDGAYVGEGVKLQDSWATCGHLLQFGKEIYHKDIDPEIVHTYSQHFS